MFADASGVAPSIIRDRTRLPAANAVLDAIEQLARLASLALAGLLSWVVPLKHLSTLNAATRLSAWRHSWLSAAGVPPARYKATPAA